MTRIPKPSHLGIVLVPLPALVLLACLPISTAPTTYDIALGDLDGDGALLYQPDRQLSTRAIILTSGLLLTLILIEVGSIAYWLPLDGVYIPGVLAWGVLIAGFMLSSVVLIRQSLPPKEASTA